MVKEEYGEERNRFGYGGGTYLHILHLIRRRGPPGVVGAESEGVRGYLANMSVSGGEPSPSTIKD